MKGPTSNLKLITFCSFYIKFERREKLFLLGFINPLENPAQGCLEETTEFSDLKEAISAKIPSANRQIVNIAGVLKPQLCASGSLRSMCVIIKIFLDHLNSSPCVILATWVFLTHFYILLSGATCII